MKSAMILATMIMASVAWGQQLEGGARLGEPSWATERSFAMGLSINPHCLEGITLSAGDRGLAKCIDGKWKSLCPPPTQEPTVEWTDVGFMSKCREWISVGHLEKCVGWNDIQFGLRSDGAVVWRKKP